MSVTTGIVQAANVNKFGYPGYKIGDTWYGGDKKGSPVAGAGDTVEFEIYKNARGYDTIKSQTVRKVTPSATAVAAVGAAPASKNVTAGKSDYALKEQYWADKAANDVQKDVRIAYQGAIDRAIKFVEVALNAQAISGYDKAKPTAKLDILRKLVDQETARILANSYSVKVPEATTVDDTAEEAPTDKHAADESDESGDWE